MPWDVIYISAALLSARYWFPSLKSVLLEIWEIGDPAHNPSPKEARRAQRASGSQASSKHPKGAMHSFPSRVSGRTSRKKEEEELSPFDRKNRERTSAFDRASLAQGRFEGGFGRRGLR